MLCKDERQRATLRRELRYWAAERERAIDPPSRPEPADGGAAPDAGRRDPPPVGESPAAAAAAPAPRRTGNRWTVASLAILLLLLAVPLLPPPEPLPPQPTAPAAAGAPATGPLCPQELPDQAVAEVWAWVPYPDYRPLLVLASATLTLLVAFMGGYRLLRAQARYLRCPRAPGGDAAPRRGLGPAAPAGPLLLDPDQRREMVWAIDRYVSEEPSRELDPEATVAATARADGEPRLVPQHPVWPREVWLWCDQKAENQEYLRRLVLEVRRALEQANLPVRVAGFHGLPRDLRWDEGGEPFAPACTEGAGARAVVAVLGDGAAWLRARDSAAERPGLERLLRELRTWPRLCLVDLGEPRALEPLAEPWGLAVRGPEGLAAWLAGRAAEPAAAPDPAGLDLWAAACLLPDATVDHADAQALRRAMGLRLEPFHYAALRERLAACTADRALADALINRLARSQALNEQGLPTGDGYFTRALDYWQRRYDDAIAALPEDDADSHARLTVARARLRLWHDPDQAARTLLAHNHGRNEAHIRRTLDRLSGTEGLRPTWNPARLGAATWSRLRALGFGSEGPRIALTAGHHLLLASLCGAALAGLGWTLPRLWTPEQGGYPEFADPRFLAQVIQARQGTSRWLGSPWHLTRVSNLGPFTVPYTWAYEPQENPRQLATGAALYISGSRNFPVHACDDGWPRRSLAVIQGTSDDADARRLAIRLLARGSADRVLVAEDWRARLDELTQGLALADDQLLLFLPAGAREELPAGIAGRVAVVSGEFAGLAAAVDFSGQRTVGEAFPGARTRVVAGEPRVVGGPEMETDAQSGVTWVRLCGGTFLMGSPDAEWAEVWMKKLDHMLLYKWISGISINNKSQATIRTSIRLTASIQSRSTVSVDTFWIMRTEVTDKNGMPLANIDWDQAHEMCGGLTSQQTWSSDLPSEAQWEHAARAGVTAQWSFGDQKEVMDTYAWYQENSDLKAHPVGEKRPNGSCLADMHGNVSEWTRECMQRYVDSRRFRLAIDPVTDAPECDTGRVMRGGSFGLPPRFLSSALRIAISPGFSSEDVGLRCVRFPVRQP